MLEAAAANSIPVHFGPVHFGKALADIQQNVQEVLATFADGEQVTGDFLVGADGIVPRITTASFQGIADQMYQLEHGVRPRIASDAVLRERLRAAATATGLKGFSERFLLSEWTNVIDAWGLTSLDDYSTVQRMGR